MKNKYIIAFTLLSITLILLLFSPRFGWKLRGFALESYLYNNHITNANHKIDTYSSTSHNIYISYPSRFSRLLQLQFDDGKKYMLEIQIDGGIKDQEPIWEQDVNLKHLLSDIIWKDSSGILYYRYILCLLLTLISIFALNKWHKEILEQKNTIILILCFLPFVLSCFVAFRVVL